MTHHYTLSLLLLLGILVLSALGSCTKEELTTINGNVAPPDSTIASTIYTGYINKAYIALSGREPTSDELNNAMALLTENKLSVESRAEMIATIMTKEAYRSNLYLVAGDKLLNGYDTSEIQLYRGVLSNALQDSSLMFAWPQVQEQLTTLDLLLSIPQDVYSNQITVKEMYRRMANNYVYDQINMGSENFVLSIFDHFLLRYPTEAELREGVTMVDGFNALLFLTEGDSKSDFLDIFFNCNEYYEGQVRDLFQRHLFREPTDEELAQFTILFKNSDDFSTLQSAILSTDEYVGL